MNVQKTVQSRKNVGMQNSSKNGNLPVKHLKLLAIFGFN